MMLRALSEHASVTVVSNDKGRLRVIDLGREADTLVLTRQ